MGKPKKILVVLTNHGQYGNAKAATGLWLGEATEFIRVVEARGYQVDYVSPQGGYVPIDPRSIKLASQADLAMYHDLNWRNRALAQSLRPDEVQAADYAAIYFTGGHGVMWDFPHDQGLQKLSLQIYQQGGYLTSVCHGIAALLYLKDPDGHYLVAGKRITGFDTAEELLSGKRRYVPFLNERVAKEHGAHFEKKRPYAPFAVQDGQLITGQNPWSPKQVAELLVKSLPAA